MDGESYRRLGSEVGVPRRLLGQREHKMLSFTSMISWIEHKQAHQCGVNRGHLHCLSG